MAQVGFLALLAAALTVSVMVLVGLTLCLAAARILGRSIAVCKAAQNQRAAGLACAEKRVRLLLTHSMPPASIRMPCVCKAFLIMAIPSQLVNGFNYNNKV